jgi:hypothetical protein
VNFNGLAADPEPVIARTGIELDRVSKNCALLFTVNWLPFRSVNVEAPTVLFTGGLDTCPEVEVIVSALTLLLRIVLKFALCQGLDKG